MNDLWGLLLKNMMTTPIAVLIGTAPFLDVSLQLTMIGYLAMMGERDENYLLPS